ncbi:MAG: rhodanese-like domain-containing protein [Gordonia sp.]|uniref:Rhodanese-like domain-containing protein n=1 Tax=Gordonia rubripertincta TaxID=36822 RepID=A0ABT4MYI7_GORRU|nr:MULTISPECIES: rhodanese-like domain-containing protein [Mycobacteriales]MBA4023042.1 rhodanese-like domain-containing protein [Gordonia sp. (in: high G+C Gram-positive bacteria)]MCZ4552063.1 rhodanese-like domain-containing protein [Gordonia rubripertincta]OZG28061.1 sulfurtransferase [Williamsia sp. 1138]
MSYAGDLTPQEAWKIITEDPTAVLVDCRTRAEWTYVGVPDLTEAGKETVFIEWVSFPDGAKNSDFVGQLRAAGVTDDQQVVFLCRSGQRSIGAAQAATADGVAKAYNVLDGFEGATDADGHRGAVGWKALGLPWRQS